MRSSSERRSTRGRDRETSGLKKETGTLLIFSALLQEGGSTLSLVEGWVASPSLLRRLSGDMLETSIPGSSQRKSITGRGLQMTYFLLFPLRSGWLFSRVSQR